MRFIQEAGGLLSLWRRGLSSISIPQVDEPSAGDVGVIEGVTAIGPEPVGAIFTGERWAVCARSGLVFTPARHLAIWGRGYG
ncbi:MAG: hypothetical protein FJ335_03750 [Sphingomonadales bacterium]|nr:hypothetical protein [Sphingomonadales bacterium]